MRFRAQLSLSLLLGLIFVMPHLALAATYYVDATAGSNSNDGLSTGAAWQTLVKVNATTFSPGDFILFKRGETFAGNIVVSQSGTSGNPITFGAYGTGARPIINASGNNHGFDIRTSKSYITVESLEVRNATVNQFLLFGNSTTISNISITDAVAYGGSGAGFTLQGAGTFTNITISTSTATGYSGASAAGVRLLSGTTFTTITLNNVTATSSTGVQGFSTGSGTYSDISILNSTFSSHTGSGINFGSGGTVSDILIRNTTSNSNGVDGIFFAGNKSDIVIENATANSNTGSGVTFEANPIDNVTVTDSEFNNNVVNGISFTGSGAGTDATISGTEASGNDNDGFNIHNSWSTLIFDDVVAESNGVDGSGADGDGVSFHETSSGIIRNSIFRNNKKSGVTNVNTASTTIYNNLFSHDTSGTSALARFYDSGTNTLYNNVFYNSSLAGTGLSAEQTATVVAKNNIIYGFDVGAQKLNTASFTEDYNLIYGAGSNNWSGISQGANSISLDPKFTNAASLDFTLLASSPAINAGVVTSYTTDRLGVTKQGIPDMGAYEYIDVVAPVITVSGSTITRYEYESLNDPGATATDNVDDSVSVTTGGNVNIAEEGTYTLTYDAVDSAGNAAIQVTRTVIVKQQGNGAPVGLMTAPFVTAPTIPAQVSPSSVPLVPNVPANAAHTVFNKNLSYRMTHPDVRNLQKYLNTNNFVMASEGPGSLGNETDYFGSLTRSALIKFQEAHAAEILAPVGLIKGTGYFGASTRAFINGR